MKDHKDVVTTPEPDSFLAKLEKATTIQVSSSLAAQIVTKIKLLKKQKRVGSESVFEPLLSDANFPDPLFPKGGNKLSSRGV